MNYKKTIVLIPTYNERENIRLIVEEVFSLYPDIKVLVIDDSSPDKTAEEVKEMMGKYSGLKILKRVKKTGLGDAYKDAIRHVLENFKEIEYVITMDADGSHQPKYIKSFLKNIENYDLIVGSRYVNGGGIESWEFWRKNLSYFGNLYSKILTGTGISDLTAGFICVRKKIFKKIDFRKIASSGYAYQIEFKFYCVKILGARVKEVPIYFKSRREGESKLSNQTITEGIITPWKCLFELKKKK